MGSVPGRAFGKVDTNTMILVKFTPRKRAGRFQGSILLAGCPHAGAAMGEKSCRDSRLIL
jgi:hypothetical protein